MDTNGNNVTPWQGMITAVRVLCPLSAAILWFACEEYQVGNILDTTFPALGAIMTAQACAIANALAGFLGAITAVLGLMISQMGGGYLGDYIAAMGVIMAATSIWSVSDPEGAHLLAQQYISYVMLIAGVASIFMPTGLSK